jgi:hypothetical protein
MSRLETVFVIDATTSQEKVIKSLLRYVNEVALSVQIFARGHGKCDGRYGLVAYRDPVDGHGKNDTMPLSTREELAAYLKTVETYSGGDDPEDWAGHSNSRYPRYGLERRQEVHFLDQRRERGRESME